MSITTLPTDSNDRKNYALFRGCMRYFPAALAGVARTSKLGNDKHNPGQEMHHARNKSADHADCVLRHLMDVDDLLSAFERGDEVTKEHILIEVDSFAWRALALSQELHEKFGSPLAPGAKSENPESLVSKLSLDDARKYLAQNNTPGKVKFPVGDTVKHINNDIEVTVQGTYWDDKGQPVLFVKDSDNRTFGVDPNFYKSIYRENV